MDALILLGFLVALALAAPRWGYDSRDGFASPEYARRQTWWAGHSGHAARVTPSLASPVPADWLGAIRVWPAPTEWTRARQATDATASERAAPIPGAVLVHLD